MPVTIAGFHHAALVVADIERAAAFYENVLGLVALPRPELGFPGRWYDLHNGQQIHLMCIGREPVHNDPPRYDRHLALNVPDTAAAETFLKAQGIAVTYGSGKAGNPQLFIRDPDGNTIELRPANW